MLSDRDIKREIRFTGESKPITATDRIKFVLHDLQNKLRQITGNTFLDTLLQVRSGDPDLNRRIVFLAQDDDQKLDQIRILPQEEDWEDTIRFYGRYAYDSTPTAGDEAWLSQIRFVSDDESREANDVVPKITDDDLMGESLASFAVSAQMNQARAIDFCNQVRRQMHQLVRFADEEDYESSKWFNGSDLNQLSERWNMEAVFVHDSHAMHWLLALKPPEVLPNGQMKILVFDPQKGGERWWTSRYTKRVSLDDLIRTGDLIGNNGVWDSLRDGSCDLSLLGDESIANDPGILDAKGVAIQFDAINCGPMCVFAAALRLAMKDGWNSFKFAGIDKMSQDLNINILTREKVLGKKN